MKLALAALALFSLGWPACDRGGGGRARNDTRVGAAPRHAGGKVEVKPVAPDALCVTKGSVKKKDGAVAIDDAAVRAVAPGSSGEAGELRFTYRGPTAETSRLQSGNVVEQIGLKLRAADGCNLVYAMWRLAPDPHLEVKVKLNPGETTHAECGTDGYRTITPTFARPTPAVTAGSEHTLHAELTATVLTVWADGDPVFEGDLGSSARDLTGPAGFRLDNAAADLTLLTAPGPAAGIPSCSTLTGD
ncbi:MAG TPA: hypothetical protein VMZ28_04790 [Kofleriaceae bacterium]|nr:hypothetical protein [Kofleriaceae bacterium]